MIDYLKGSITYQDENGIVLDVGNIGYRILCANPYEFAQGDAAAVVFTHFHVREDAIQLFGFASREEQNLFRRLLNVSGIGPKVALAILSGTRPAPLVAAIRAENISFLTKLPGVGKKTAQRIILDLKDKLDEIDLPADASVATDTETATAAVSPRGRIWTEAKDGLIALGYNSAEADRALAEVRAASEQVATSVEEVMRLALQHLYKG